MRPGKLAGLLYVPRELVTEDGIQKYTLKNPAYDGAIKSGARYPKEPRYIHAYTFLGDYVGFPPYSDPHLLAPRGLVIEDLRVKGSEFPATFDVEKARTGKRPWLFPEQQLAVNKLKHRGHGILVAKPGQGKTNILLWLMCELGRTTLILAHTGQLVDQWVGRMQLWTDVPAEAVGVISEGKRTWDGHPICVAMINAAYMDVFSDDRFRNHFGVCMVDEVHHMSAATFHPCIGVNKAFYKFGASATPYREDKLDRIFMDHLGGITAVMKNLAPDPTVHIWPHNTGVDMSGCLTRTGEPFLPWMINALVDSEDYNDFLEMIGIVRLKAGYKTIAVSDRADHCVELAQRLAAKGFDATFIVADYTNPDTGKKKHMSVKEREKRYHHQYIACTPGTMAEGIDIDDIECVQFVTPFKSKRRIEQAVGRAQREYEGKKKPVVDDVFNEEHRVLQALGMKRRKHYGALKWPTKFMRQGRSEEDPVAAEARERASGDNEF